MKPVRSSEAIDAALARLLAPLGDWGLDGVLQCAADIGMLVTPDRRQRLYLLAWRLAEAGVQFADAHDAAVTFGSVLCTTAEDQAVFERDIRKIWFKDSGLKIFPDPYRDQTADLPPSRITRILALLSSRPLLIAAIVIAVVAALGLVIWFVAMRSGVKVDPTHPIPGPTTTDRSASLLAAAALDLFQRTVVALPAVIAAWLSWTWWRPLTSIISREQGSADRLERFTRPDLNTLFRGTAIRLAFDTLRRAVRIQSLRIDVRSSLRETVRAAGWPTIRHATLRNSLEVVLFVDREGASDHLAFLAQLLEDRLRAAGATVTRYDFRLTPTRLTQVSGRPEGAAVEDLERIVARHVGQRLILIGDGRGLVEGEDLDDELRLRRLLGEFAQVHILTPTPENSWEERERRLLLAGFNVAFCDRDGIEDSARISTLLDWTEPLAATLRSIRREPDPFLAHLELEYHRYAVDYPVLQPAAGAPDGPIATTGLTALQIRALVSALQAWMGSRPAFRLLVAVAVFPSVKPSYTLAIADAVSQDAESPGAALDESLYARLARLPWLRDGRFPDWLRLALARRLTEPEREAMARAHMKLLAPMAVAHGAIVAQASLEIARKSLRANMDPDHPLAERLFLAMLFGQAPKADLLRPKATSAIAEALGEERRLAPRITAAGFLVAAVLGFFFKDTIVYPALSAAGSWLTNAIRPLLPIGLFAEIARYLAIVCAATAVFWPQRSRAPLPSNSAISVRNLAGLPAAPWALRLVMSLVGAGLAALGLRNGDWLGEGLAGVVVVFSLLAVGGVLFERHPAWNGDLWLNLDLDTAAINGTEPLKRYPLGDAIASGDVVKPALIVAALSSFLYIIIVGGVRLASYQSNLGNMVTTTAALALGYTLLILAIRRMALGSWTLASTLQNRSRHLFIDVISSSVAAAIFLLLTVDLLNKQDGNLSEVTIYFRLTAALSSVVLLLMISALGLSPLTAPIGGGEMKTNLASGLLINGISITIVGLFVTGNNVRIFAFAAVASLLMQFILVIILTPLASSSVPLTFKAGILIRRAWHARKRMFLALFVITFAIASTISMETWRNNINHEAVQFAGWFLVGLIFWPMFRVFGAVSLIEGLRGRPSNTSSVARSSLFLSHLDTPWWATILLSGLLVPRWAVPLLPWQPDQLSADLIVLVPAVCIGFAYRYGSTSLWPLALGLLPHVVAAHDTGFVLLGEPGFVVAMLFWARFVADPTLRRSLLARDKLPFTDMLLLSPALALTVTINLPASVEFVLGYDPGWLIFTTAIVIGLSRMPSWKFLLLLAILVIGREGIEVFSVAQARPGGASAPPITPTSAIASLEFGLRWSTAVLAVAVTLLTRLCLRKAMLLEGKRPSASGSTTTTAFAIRRIVSPAVRPIVLFVMLYLAWIIATTPIESAANFDQLRDVINRSPAIAATGLMLGLLAVHGVDLVLLLVILFPIPLAITASSALTGGPASAVWPFTFNATMFVVGVSAIYVVLGFAIRLVAEDPRTIPSLLSRVRRIFAGPVWPFSSADPEPIGQSTSESSVSQIAETTERAPDSAPDPVSDRPIGSDEGDDEPQLSGRGKASKRPSKKRARK